MAGTLYNPKIGNFWVHLRMLASSLCGNQTSFLSTLSAASAGTLHVWERESGRAENGCRGAVDGAV